MNTDYCNAMQGGLALICFLYQMEEEPYTDIWLYCLTQHSMFPLLLQRLIIIVAREAMGMNDGKKLGIYVRNILADLANNNYKQQNGFDKHLVLCKSEDVGCFRKAAIPAMLRADGVMSVIEGLCDQLEEWME
jgi:hypothetical protein